MGAWGEKAFENDAALDWLAELEAQGAPWLRAALSTVERTVQDQYLDVDDAAAAIAAAEIVCAALGHGRDRVPARVSKWIDANASAITDEDAACARRAVERVLAKGISTSPDVRPSCPLRRPQFIRVQPRPDPAAA